MKKTLIFIGIILLFVGCAVSNQEIVDANGTLETYGFFGGLWHGITAPFSMIGKLFNDEIVIYSCWNNGVPYDLGYVFGIGAFGKSVF